MGVKRVDWEDTRRKKRSKIVPIFIALMFFILNSAHAEFRAPSPLNENEKAEYISEKYNEIIGVRIDDISLKKITEILGAAKIYEGTHTASHVCYKSKNEKLEFTVSSFGYGYTVSSNSSKLGKCKELNKEFINGAGLKLRLSKSEVLSLAGDPSKKEKNRFTYIFWVQEKPKQEVEEGLRTAHEIPKSEEIWLDVYSVIDVYFVGGLVQKYSVSTTKTY
jgi:hypothetical protein